MFAEDCTEREANAVNSEHKKNLQADMWRFYQLEKHLSSPTHPYNKFGTGNLETLWTHPKAEDRDPRAELIQWWEKEYCSQRMKLVVLGKESLDTLEKWIRDRFEKVPNKGKGVVMYQEEVFEPEQMGVSRLLQASMFQLIDLKHLRSFSISSL
jgi:insulysin